MRTGSSSAPAPRSSRCDFPTHLMGRVQFKPISRRLSRSVAAGALRFHALRAQLTRRNCTAVDGYGRANRSERRRSRGVSTQANHPLATSCGFIRSLACCLARSLACCLARALPGRGAPLGAWISVGSDVLRVRFSLRCLWDILSEKRNWWLQGDAQGRIAAGSADVSGTLRCNRGEPLMLFFAIRYLSIAANQHQASEHLQQKTSARCLHSLQFFLVWVPGWG